MSVMVERARSALAMPAVRALARPALIAERWSRILRGAASMRLRVSTRLHSDNVSCRLLADSGPIVRPIPACFTGRERRERRDRGMVDEVSPSRRAGRKLLQIAASTGAKSSAMPSTTRWR